MIYILLLVLILFLMRFNFFRIPKKGIIVLLYHRVSNDKTNTNLDKFTITKKIFEKHMKLLKLLGYTTVLPNQIDSVIENKLYLNKRFVIITFDDGYKDNMEAAQILKKYAFKAIFFISTAYIGKIYNKIEMLNSSNISLLKNMGMAIGSHSHNHVKLAELTYSEAINNVKISINILTNFDTVEDFSYPYGNLNTSIMKILKTFSLKRAYIIGQRMYNPLKDSNFKIPRAIIRKDTTMLDFYLLLTRGRSHF